jgi:hypothetical protein
MVEFTPHIVYRFVLRFRLRLGVVLLKSKRVTNFMVNEHCHITPSSSNLLRDDPFSCLILAFKKAALEHLSKSSSLHADSVTN